ncbi:MAG TPA: hypothetical protein VNJ12_09950 [Candidatus Dormibacteraeota bacterium]|nr:hypothetical protein [Candidatus Dormibacteraeota bacterium]
MSRRAEIGILVALFLVLGGVLYRNFRPPATSDSDGPADIAIHLLKVPNPALHLDQLARIRQLAYTGSHRNIFSATPPPPPVAPHAATKRDAAPAVRAGPPGPLPLQVPLTFYGMAIDPKTGNKLAFFTNGDNVYIASPGETLLGHFRLLTIDKDTVRIEDTTTSQSAVIPMTPLKNP